MIMIMITIMTAIKWSAATPGVPVSRPDATSCRLTTIQGLPRRFDQKKILKVIKKKFACNGTIVEDSEMGDVIQLQGDQRKAIHEFLIDKKEGLEMDAKMIKVHGF
ncbi:hypothetical protein BN1723_009289 [Verticillium longisporum]|uniref:SUI1 domain-containing protein n=1 Tax=Verticillium longisporum TaxID=100787 RepID=A0A0G4KN08_VERLO|nr:hypothetical protein BN1723_009289 [Verticillium longisporum]